MARLSSTSTESDYVPAMVPFHWEVAPGRPAVTEIVDAPSLPLPPGQRPKDGFYLPFSRPAQLPHVLNKAGGGNSSSRERRLKFPGSSKKPFFTSQKRGKHIECVDDADEDGDVFSPVSSHRFSSRITRRVLVEFQKRRSCLGACLLRGRKGSSSNNHHNTGERLDSVNEEEIRAAPTDSGSSPVSSPSSRGHGSSRNSSVAAGDRRQSQVQSQVPGGSRFVASMLMFLCPDESDEAEAVDHEITGDGDDSFSSSGHVTMPRARVSSSGAIIQGQGVAVDPALSTMVSHEDRTLAWVDMSTARLQEEPTMSNLQCKHCGNRQPSINPTAEPAASLLRRDSLHEQLEPNHPPASRRISSLPRTLLQNQAEVTSPKGFRIKDKLKVPGSTSVTWVEALKSSPRWPNPAPKTCAHAVTSDDECENDSDASSVELSEHETYESQTPSLATPTLPRKPATWEISQKLLKSSSLLKYKQQRQQSHESPRSSFMVDEEASTSPCPNYDPKRADHGVVIPAGSLPEMLNSNYGVMSKVAQWESKAGVASSGKSLPIYLSRRRGTTTPRQSSFEMIAAAK